MSKLKKTKMVISLLTWQTSLIFISITFLILSGVLVVASPKTREAIQDTAVDVVKASFSDVSTIVINKDLSDSHIFIYNKISNNPDRPMEIEPIYKDSKTFLELFPGSYTLGIIKEGYEPIEKDLLINVGEKELEVYISFEKEKDVQEETKNSDKDISYLVSPYTGLSNLNSDTDEKHLADLTIEDINIIDPNTNETVSEIESGELVVIEALISNKGDVTSYSFQYKWAYRKQNSIWQELYTNTRPGIAYQDNSPTKLTYSWKTPLEAGKYDLKLELDTTNTIDEIEENNNIATYNVSLVSTGPDYDIGIEDVILKSRSGQILQSPQPGQECIAEIILRNYSEVKFDKAYSITILANGEIQQSFNQQQASNIEPYGVFTANLNWIPKENVKTEFRVKLLNNIPETNYENNQHIINS
ncbi:hypothetical protein GF362_06310 [Candidatus Dojkabacteria bacterium]|nr:hypothetical protein [Candidatus Dojkabacteria bacterium]